ncbi:MAG TPA: class IV adenylate cyclase [Spirochaetia bacterium]|nr:MAG: hypothetical protein A2Y41_10290 [Spirochaetes bacterium GWB1_36_13]HCL57285.1 class IV adenylate cyclase [Spirochaetia bacterium]
MIEIEKKAYLKDLKILDKIKEIAFYKGEKHKEDVYFAPINIERINIYKDPIFRIRIEEGKKILSYKKKKFIDKTEVNDEHEIDISGSDIPQMRAFFRHIGYLPFIEKKKKTSLYVVKDLEGYDVSIEHNEVEKLGEFIEIEVLAQNESEAVKVEKIICDLFKKIGIKDEDIEPKYYIDLLMEK